MSHGPAQPQITRDPRLLEGWRAAAAAYRKTYGEPRDGTQGHNEPSMKAAIAAMKEAVPGISDENAMLEAIAAVSYVSQTHPEWLYALYPGPPKRQDR